MNLPPRAAKLLPLALSASAAEGEWRNAAQLFFKLLRESGFTPDSFNGGQRADDRGGHPFSGFETAFTEEVFKRAAESARRRQEAHAHAYERPPVWEWEEVPMASHEEQERFRRHAERVNRGKTDDGYPENSPPFRNFVMPFGKHEGKALAVVPLDYLQWLVRSCDIASTTLKNHARDEINYRMGRKGK